MTLTITSQEGHYNLFQPSEKSITTYITVRDAAGEVLLHTNVTTDELIEEEWPDQVVDQVVELIEDNFKRYLFSTARPEQKALRDFILENCEEIVRGNRERLLKSLRTQRENINRKIRILEEAQ